MHQQFPYRYQNLDKMIKLKDKPLLRNPMIFELIFLNLFCLTWFDNDQLRNDSSIWVACPASNARFQMPIASDTHSIKIGFPEWEEL